MNNKGITLIALVIIVIVLAILIGVAIQLSLNNGIIKRAAQSSYEYSNSQKYEKQVIEDSEDQIELLTGGRTLKDDDVKKLILEIAYPVGSIYSSVSEENPADFIGGEWEHISEGRVLMGAGTNGTLNYTAGTTVEPGLPNITGRSNLCLWAHGPTGAFYMTRNGSYNNAGGVGGQAAEYFADFNAARCSAIYGRSSTVQPPAYIVYMWQRTA